MQDDQELVDVFSYVELVQDCLERAEINQKACLEGIIKSDLALRQSQSDADIHFIVLVRRAELLLICVRLWLCIAPISVVFGVVSGMFLPLRHNPLKN